MAFSKEVSADNSLFDLSPKQINPKINDPRMLCGGKVCGGRIDYFGDHRCPIAEEIKWELKHGLDAAHPNQIKEEAIRNLRKRIDVIQASNECAFADQLEEASVLEPNEFAKPDYFRDGKDRKKSFKWPEF